MLNYHHLHYFWVVAREGSVVRAAARLQVAQPTVSIQLKVLEETLGEKLFRRRGRQLELTEMGHVVLRYADEIFALGSELVETVAGRPSGRPQRFTVGVSDSLPKLTTWLLLEPTIREAPSFQLVLRVGKAAQLLSDLAGLALDVVLADEALPAQSPIRAFSHLLGESDVTIFGVEGLAARHRRAFPRSLHEAPLVLQTGNTALRRSLESYFSRARIAPKVVAEAEDMGMLQVLGQEGLGLFAAPTVAAEAIKRQHGVVAVGRLPEVRERFYAITLARRLEHPAAVALSKAARTELFG